MKCAKCGTPLEDTANFCKECGEARPISAVERDQKSPKAIPDDQTEGRGFFAQWIFTHRITLAIASTALISIGFLSSNLNGNPTTIVESPSATSDPVALTAFEVLGVDGVSTYVNAMCPLITDGERIPLKQFLADVTTNTPSLSKATKNAWAAAAWKKANSSWFGGTTYSQDLRTAIKFRIAQELDPLLSKDLTTYDYGNYWQDKDSWFEYFFEQMSDKCKWGETIKKIAAYDAKLSQVETLSQSIPWYPKGFKETGFDSFAFKNISNQGCSYSFGSCAKFKIVSKTDCLTNLYVRTNHLVNGEVDDWSNDSASVSAGQVAIMETSFSSGSAGSWQIVEINCY